MNDVQESSSVSNGEINSFPQVPDRSTKPKVLPRRKHATAQNFLLSDENGFTTILDRNGTMNRQHSSWDSSENGESSNELHSSNNNQTNSGPSKSPVLSQDRKAKELSHKNSQITIVRTDTHIPNPPEPEIQEVKPPTPKSFYSEDIGVRTRACTKIQKTYRTHLATREEKRKFSKLCK